MLAKGFMPSSSDLVHYGANLSYWDFKCASNPLDLIVTRVAVAIRQPDDSVVANPSQSMQIDQFPIPLDHGNAKPLPVHLALQGHDNGVKVSERRMVCYPHRFTESGG